MDFLIDLFDRCQQTLFEAVVQPIAFAAGQGHLLDKAYEGIGWVVVGLFSALFRSCIFLADKEKSAATSKYQDQDRSNNDDQHLFAFSGRGSCIGCFWFC